VPTLYGTSTVHIIIADDNDNQPQFTHPSPADNHTALVHLTSSLPVGHVVTHVTAVDADVGVNGRLSYSMSGGSELFAIDDQSGEVRVASPLRAGTYQLLISVSDSGTSRLSSQTALYVVVNDTSSSHYSSYDVVSRRSALANFVSGVDVTWWIVAAACLSVVLVVMCLFIASVNSRRSRKRRARSNDTVTTTTTRAQPVSVCGREASLVPDVDPLTSAMLRRHQLDDITGLDQTAAGLMTAGDYVDYMQSIVGCADVSAQVSSSIVAIVSVHAICLLQ